MKGKAAHADTEECVCTSVNMRQPNPRVAKTVLVKTIIIHLHSLNITIRVHLLQVKQPKGLRE